jgi:hypothetical protein
MPVRKNGAGWVGRYCMVARCRYSWCCSGPDRCRANRCCAAAAASPAGNSVCGHAASTSGAQKDWRVVSSNATTPHTAFTTPSPPLGKPAHIHDQHGGTAVAMGRRPAAASAPKPVSGAFTVHVTCKQSLLQQAASKELKPDRRSRADLRSECLSQNKRARAGPALIVRRHWGWCRWPT